MATKPTPTAVRMGIAIHAHRTDLTVEYVTDYYNSTVEGSVHDAFVKRIHGYATIIDRHLAELISRLAGREYVKHYPGNGEPFVCNLRLVMVNWPFTVLSEEETTAALKRGITEVEG